MNTADKQKIAKQFEQIRKIDPTKIIPVQNRHQYAVTDLGQNSAFELDGKTYLVAGIGTYRETDDTYKKETGDSWQELKCYCLDDGTVHGLEIEADDGEIAIHFTLSEVKYNALTYDDGKSIAKDSDDLDEIADQDEDVVFNGKTYEYDDDYAACYYPQGDDKAQRAYFYEFLAEDDESLTIEVWVGATGKEDFEVYVSKSIDPHSLEILSLG